MFREQVEDSFPLFLAMTLNLLSEDDLVAVIVQPGVKPELRACGAADRSSNL